MPNVYSRLNGLSNASLAARTPGSLEGRDQRCLVWQPRQPLANGCEFVCSREACRQHDIYVLQHSLIRTVRRNHRSGRFIYGSLSKAMMFRTRHMAWNLTPVDTETLTLARLGYSCSLPTGTGKHLSLRRVAVVAGTLQYCK